MKSREDVENFLMKEMPGEWKKKHITEITMCLPCNEKFYRTPGVTECVHNTFEEIDRLFKVIHSNELYNVCDPFGGTGTISKYIKNNFKDIQIISNDLCKHHGEHDFYENALDIEFYEQFGESFDAIITSPWFAILDLAIPILMKYARYFIAVHVPAYYITNAHEHRIKFIKRLMRQGRVHIVGNLPHAVIGWRCVWLLIFKDRSTARRYIKRDLKSINYYI